MKILKTRTIEQQIVEIDSYIDELIRKPRGGREITVTAIPQGVQILSIESDISRFVNFYTIAGVVQGIQVKTSGETRNVSVSLELITAQGTQLINNLAQPIAIEANTKLSIQFSTDKPLAEALIGFLFIPKVS